MANKVKFAFGSEAGIDAALQAGVINERDFLLLDGENGAKVGWIDKNGQKVIADGKDNFVEVDTLPVANGRTDVIYRYNNEAYIWNTVSGKCEPLSKSVDLTEFEAKLESFEKSHEGIEYLVSNKPIGTLVDYRDKEIRIMCPADTVWTFQDSGEGSDPNMYYIGIKAYAPNDTVVGFKEDMAVTISDDTLYSFENNPTAGVEADGRKYSIFWLPVATYDETSQVWTYYGASSSKDKYIGWYYSVEWYDNVGEVIASDCIKINLANESCFSSIEPFYMTGAIKEAKDYADEQIEAKIAEMPSVEIIEF